MTADLEKYKIWIETLEPLKSGNFEVRGIEVSDYADLGFLISSLLKVCRDSIETENSIEPYQVSRVLELAQSLIPHSELRLVDKFNQEINNNQDGNSREN